MNFKKYIWLFVCLLGIFAFFYINNKNTSKIPSISSIKQVKIAGQIVKVELALDGFTQSQGLSGRSELKENEGMLFIFRISKKHSFWMKDMNFPIDIIWIDEDLRVNFIKKNALPSSYPEAFSPDGNSLYVLEVNSQFLDKNNLKEGDKVKFLP